MIKVRPADLDDTDWLMSALGDFDSFAGHKRSIIGDYDFAVAALRNIISSHFVRIAYSDHRMGFIAGYVSPHPLNPKIKTLTELFWWVPESCRRSRAAAMLLNEFVRFGQEHADWVIFSLERHSPVRDTHLIRRGFKLVERAFLLEV